MSEEREAYVRGLLGDMRSSVMDLRDTERTYRDVHAEYQDGVEERAAQIIARQRADLDARVVRAVGLGAWHRERITALALAYLAERDADDRRARR